MPSQARIDAPGALHHIAIREIERKGIFEDDEDREDFLERLFGLLQEMVTPCYAWALMTNQVHLLLRTGTVPIASIMRRLSTGYSEVARRLNLDHSTINRTVRRAGNDPDPIAAAKTTLGLVESETCQD